MAPALQSGDRGNLSAGPALLSLNAIMSNALTSLQTSSTALRATAGNVSNINTDGYHRRVVRQEVLAPGGQLAGVGIAEIRRVVDQFFQRETLAAASAAARFEAQSGAFARLDAALGQPGDGTSLGARLDAIYASIGQASLDPASFPRRQGVVAAFDTLAQTVARLSNAIADTRREIDHELASTVGHANTLIRQIHELNPQIQRAVAAGLTSTGLLDQRDQAIRALAEIMAVRTSEQADGRLFVSTETGLSLVSDMYSQLSYEAGGVTGVYKPVTIERIHSMTGETIGNPQLLDSQVTDGKLKGLLDMRDRELVEIAEELGALARGVALAANAQHNANASFPPPSELVGRQTGLLASDGLGFTGRATFAVTGGDGALVSRIDVDFDAGTLSVDGGAASGFAATIGGFVAALDGALGGNGAAEFSDGVLRVSSAGGGIVVAGDAAAPATRGGHGLSHFFGLNDVFAAAAPAILETGLAGDDLHGLAPGGAIALVLRGPDGQRVRETSVAVTGTTIADMIGALNAAFAGAAAFALGADGRLSITPAPGLSAYRVEVTADTTARGTTGIGLSGLFGIGTAQLAAQAANFRVRGDLVASPERLALALPQISADTAAGDIVVARGDNRGALALEALGETSRSFSKAGALNARAATLGEFASAVYQDIGGRAARVDARRIAETDRSMEAEARRARTEGVNLDEELANMMLYQQAYGAGARMLRMAQELFDALLAVA